MTVTSNATASRRTPAGNFVQRCCLLGTVAVLSLATFGAVAQTPAQTPAQAPERAGIAAGVAGKVQISEGARKAPEAVKTGMDILMRDRVQSENAGRMQVLLMDETVFTIGPNSDLVIDEFVYDPSTGAGKVTANFTKGMLRYVSGKVAAANPAGVTIRTATATIGVRGTSLFIVDAPAQGAEGDETDEGTQFIGLLGPGDKNDGNLKAGGLTVTGGGVSVDVLRAGNGVFTTPGQPVGPVVPTPPEILQLVANGMTGQLPSEGGAAGGGEGEGEGEEGEGDSSAADSSGSDTAEAGASAGDVAAVAGALGDTGEAGAKATADSNTDEVVESVNNTITSGNTTGNLPDGVVIPALIALQWSNIGNVDLHLTGPAGIDGERFHVFFDNPGNYNAFPFALLDHDNIAESDAQNSEWIGLGMLESPFDDASPFRVVAFNLTESDNDDSTSLSDPANGVRFSLIINATIVRGPDGSTITGGTVIATITPPAGATGHTWTIEPDVDFDTNVVAFGLNEISNNHTDGLGVSLDVFNLVGIAATNTSGNLPTGVVIPALVAATWSQDGDLTGQIDLWLTGPNVGAINANDRFHVTWSSQGNFTAAPFARLDNDNGTGGNGLQGEFIGISQFNPGTTPYRVILLNYNEATSNIDNSNKFSNPANDFHMFFVSGGTITRGPGGSTVTGGSVVTQITPPASSIGHTWIGFDINPGNQAVTVINQVNSTHTDGFGVELDGFVD